jgi:transposase
MAHSTESYSDDLRKRVVDSRLSGMSALDVSAQFSVSVGTVRNWVLLYQETGAVLQKPRGGYKSSKITDMKKFEAFAKAHAHCTLKQMQAKWEDEVSEMTISRALKRLGWTRKKSKPTTANVTSRSAKPS